MLLISPRQQNFVTAVGRGVIFRVDPEDDFHSGCQKCQSPSPQTVLLRTTLTRMIIIYILYLQHCFANKQKMLHHSVREQCKFHIELSTVSKGDFFPANNILCFCNIGVLHVYKCTYQLSCSYNRVKGSEVMSGKGFGNLDSVEIYCSNTP